MSLQSMLESLSTIINAYGLASAAACAHRALSSPVEGDCDRQKFMAASSSASVMVDFMRKTIAEFNADKEQAH